MIGRVAFVDAEGNELIAAGDWAEKRSVEPGATFTLRFFGPLGTTRIEVERMSFFARRVGRAVDDEENLLTRRLISAHR